MTPKTLLSRLMPYRPYATTILPALGPLLVIVAAGIAFHGFVWRAIEGNPVLNSGILLVALAGAGLILARLAEAISEHVALNRFRAEVENDRDLRDMREITDEPWLKGKMVRRYIACIIQTEGRLSSRLDQEAIEGELQSIGDEIESRLELPGFLVGFMVAMGLLGTFIGLLETLTGISGMLDGMTTAGNASVEQEFLRMVTELRRPLAGMGIAFSASLFGLVGSLMLGLMLLSARRFCRRLQRDARSLLTELTERVDVPVVVGGAVNRPGVSEGFVTDTMAELVSNINDLQDLFHRSQDASLQLNSRIDGLARRLEQLAQSVEDNVSAIRKTNDLLGFGPRMKETNEQVLSELRDLNSRSNEQQRIWTRLIDVMNAIDQKLGMGNDSQRLYQDAQGTVSRDTLTKIEELTGLLQSLNDRSQDSETRLDRKLQGLATSTTTMASGVQQLAAKLGEISTIGQSQLNANTSSQQIIREAILTVTSALSDLQAQIKKLEDAQVGSSRHLFEIKESFSAMATSLEALDQIRQGISQQGSLLEGNLDEMRTSQRTLARDLQREMREALRGVLASVR